MIRAAGTAVSLDARRRAGWPPSAIASSAPAAAGRRRAAGDEGLRAGRHRGRGRRRVRARSARTTRRSWWPSSADRSAARGPRCTSSASCRPTRCGRWPAWSTSGETVDRPVARRRAGQARRRARGSWCRSTSTRRAAEGRLPARRTRRRWSARRRDAGLAVEGLMTIGRAGRPGGSAAGLPRVRALADRPRGPPLLDGDERRSGGGGGGGFDHGAGGHRAVRPPSTPSGPPK